MSTLTTLDCFDDFRDGHSSFVSIVVDVCGNIYKI